MIPLLGGSLWVKLVMGATIVASIFGAGTWTGWKWNSISYEKYKAQVAEEKMLASQAMLKALEQANARTAAAESAYRAASAQLKKQVVTITKEVVREVEKPVYRCELPADGRVFLDHAVREANAAIRASGEVP